MLPTPFYLFLTTGKLGSERGGLSTYLPGKGREVVCVLGGGPFLEKIGHGVVHFGRGARFIFLGKFDNV